MSLLYPLSLGPLTLGWGSKCPSLFPSMLPIPFGTVPHGGNVHISPSYSETTPFPCNCLIAYQVSLMIFFGLGKI